MDMNQLYKIYTNELERVNKLFAEKQITAEVYEEEIEAVDEWVDVMQKHLQSQDAQMPKGNIDILWLNVTNSMADLFEKGKVDLSRFTGDQLHYLIYWNWGYSCTSEAEATRKAKEELEQRGEKYDELRACDIESQAAANY